MLDPLKFNYSFNNNLLNNSNNSNQVNPLATSSNGTPMIGFNSNQLNNQQQSNNQQLSYERIAAIRELANKVITRKMTESNAVSQLQNNEEIRLFYTFLGSQNNQQVKTSQTAPNLNVKPNQSNSQIASNAITALTSEAKMNPTIARGIGNVAGTVSQTIDNNKYLKGQGFGTNENTKYGIKSGAVDVVSTGLEYGLTAAGVPQPIASVVGQTTNVVGKKLLGKSPYEKFLESEKNRAQAIQNQQDRNKAFMSKFTNNVSSYSMMARTGGKVVAPKGANIIPKGVLHEEYNNMGDKGIPVLLNGQKIAEIEKEEIIFNVDVSNKIDKLVEKYNETKDRKYLIELGSLIKKEIKSNTFDHTCKFIPNSYCNV